MLFETTIFSYAVRRTQYDRLSQQQLSLLYLFSSSSRKCSWIF